MSSQNPPTVLLTNDDGIDSSGIQILYEELSEFADVTVVAPSVDHSGIGRVLSFGRSVPLGTGSDSEGVEVGSSDLKHEVAYADHELGYAVEGTPCDCVIAGVTALELNPDVVVSGCNPGPNLGVTSFGRSGTVSAAVEAARLGVPSVAVSSGEYKPTDEDYQYACEFARNLIEFSLANEVFRDVDYLNLSIPTSSYRSVRLTRPVEKYGFTATDSGEKSVFEFSHAETRRTFTTAESSTDLISDREALKQDSVSITPFQLPFTPTPTSTLKEFVDSHC